MTTAKRRSPLMVSVWAELGAGRIVEGFIHDPRVFVDGETSHTGHITINPVHQLVDTVIHEILHRLHPEWSENYVRRTTTFLRRRMTDAETQQFYDEYQARVIKRGKRGRRARSTPAPDPDAIQRGHTSEV